MTLGVQSPLLEIFGPGSCGLDCSIDVATRTRKGQETLPCLRHLPGPSYVAPFGFVVFCQDVAINNSKWDCIARCRWAPQVYPAHLEAPWVFNWPKPARRDFPSEANFGAAMGPGMGAIWAYQVGLLSQLGIQVDSMKTLFRY